jgi:transcriptional regulator with XRE-family HTH domain
MQLAEQKIENQANWCQDLVDRTTQTRAKSARQRVTLMNQERKGLQAPQSEMRASRLRLIRAREAAGKTPQDLGEYLENVPTYYDMKACDGELYSVASLGELSRLCLALGIKPRDLFDDKSNIEGPILPEQLLSEAKEYIKKRKLSVAEFSDCVGFEIEPSLKDPSKMLDWNVDFLRWLCDEIGLDWRLALPEAKK